MSQQINLINPALRKQRDWLTAPPLAIATGIMLVIIIASAVWARQQAEVRLVEADQRASVLKTAQDRLAEQSKAVGDIKPNQQLADELANSRTMLNLREEVMAALEGGAFSNSSGFAEYLRGFARQAPSGLWLSGFTIGSGGEEMEIRGRMLNPVALPEYIQRLNVEKAFQGRSFSSLSIKRPEAVATTAAPATPAVSGTAAAALPKSAIFVDFVLTSTAADGSKTSSQNPASGSAEIKR